MASNHENHDHNHDEHAPLLGGPQTQTRVGGSHPIPVDPNADNLTKWRHAIGVNCSLDETHDVEPGHQCAPKGLYAEIIHLRRVRNLQYHLVDVLYYVIVIAQILIGTTLASLGPLSMLHNNAITILGVVNASIAGILALLKGQGLPDRLRKDMYQMKKVQDFIEMEETRLAVKPRESITDRELAESVQKIFDAYSYARDTAEMNRPSSYAVQVEQPAGMDADDGNAGENGPAPPNSGGPPRTGTGSTVQPVGRFAIL